jgi:ATP-dependent Lhr-like helicase
VAGVTGEQFALPEAVASLRATRRSAKTGRLVALSASDPLNLVGIVVPGARVAALASNRILFEDGTPVAVREGKAVTLLVDVDATRAAEFECALLQKPATAAKRARFAYGRTTVNGADATLSPQARSIAPRP